MNQKFKILILKENKNNNKLKNQKKNIKMQLKNYK